MSHSSSCSKPTVYARVRAAIGLAIGLAIVALLLVSAAALAEPATSKRAAAHRSTTSARHARTAKRHHRSHAASASRAVTKPGLRVAIDPATGALTQPTREQVRSLSAESAPASSHPLAPLQATRLPDGTLKVDLGDRFMNYAVAHIDSTGALHIDERARRDSVAR